MTNTFRTDSSFLIGVYMKKVFLITFISLFIGLFISCSSLPTAPKSGVTIAAGRVEMNYSGYDDISFNGI